MKKYGDVDLYKLDSLLTVEEAAVKSEVRHFVDQACMPLIVEHFDKGAFPMDLIPQMAEQHLFGLHVDGYGCRPQSHLVMD
jgi:glutaryl-CoA dehydrogenase